MSRCLRDRTLWKLSEGEGTRAQRSHMEACPDCATRYQRLERDMVVLRRILQEVPRPQPVLQRLRASRIWWLPVAAALAIALAWVGGGRELWQQRPPGLPMEAQYEVASYLRAALDGDWPCNGQEPFFHLDCDQPTSSPFDEGP